MELKPIQPKSIDGWVKVLSTENTKAGSSAVQVWDCSCGCGFRVVSSVWSDAHYLSIGLNLLMPYGIGVRRTVRVKVKNSDRVVRNFAGDGHGFVLLDHAGPGRHYERRAQ